MSVELWKYMVIHIYGITLTLNTAKSADQYYSSYSYQSLSLIIYLTYNDLHHDCKPYEQTREFFSLLVQSLAAGWLVGWLNRFRYRANIARVPKLATLTG